jgi:hypothetical protein
VNGIDGRNLLERDRAVEGRGFDVAAVPAHTVEDVLACEQVAFVQPGRNESRHAAPDASPHDAERAGSLKAVTTDLASSFASRHEAARR